MRMCVWVCLLRLCVQFTWCTCCMQNQEGKIRDMNTLASNCQTAKAFSSKFPKWHLFIMSVFDDRLAIIVHTASEFMMRIGSSSASGKMHMAGLRKSIRCCLRTVHANMHLAQTATARIDNKANLWIEQVHETNISLVAYALKKSSYRPWKSFNNYEPDARIRCELLDWWPNKIPRITIENLFATSQLFKILASVWESIWIWATCLCVFFLSHHNRWVHFSYATTLRYVLGCFFFMETVTGKSHGVQRILYCCTQRIKKTR